MFLKESASLFLLPFLARGYTLHVSICVFFVKKKKINEKTQQKNNTIKLQEDGNITSKLVDI
jgi:hypothetical protein